jgi:tetratricopeptide (TPR) repeat protein
MRPVATLLVLVMLVVAPCFAPVARSQMTEADVYVNTAILDFEDKRYDSALDNLRRALEIEPGNVEALYYSGVVRVAQGRAAEAVPFLEKARERSPEDTAITTQLGLAYFAQQDYDRARPLLEEAFRKDPTLDGLGYYVGFIRYRSKDYRGALQAFRQGRTTDTDLQQLTKVYTGLSLAAVGLPAQATSEIEAALRIAPGSAITGPAERLRDAVVAARQRDRRFNFEARFGVMYDDNVRVVPDPVGQSGDPIVASLRRGRKDSSGEIGGVRAEYTFFRDDQFESSIGYSFFGTYYNNISDFSNMDHLVTLSGLYKTALGSVPLSVGAQYSYDALFLDDDWFLQRHTVTAFTTVVPSDLYLTQLAVRYQNKNFNDPSSAPHAEIRDAENWMGGLLQFFRFEEDRHYLKIGYQLDYENSIGSNYEYVGNRFLAGGQYTLPWWGVRLKYDFDVHLRGYLNQNTILPSNDPGHRRRYDKELNNTVRVELPLPSGFTLAGEYLNTNAISNLQAFDYTRNVFSLTLSWNY